VRVGGRFRIVFGGPEGRDHEVQGVYREVVPNRKLVFTWTWPSSTPERVSLVTVSLNAVARGTELVFLHEQFFDETVRDNHRQGWSESFVKLERFLLAERPALSLVRSYPVAPEKVWRAWTDPEALRLWWNQAEGSVEMDVRVGGRYRFVLRDPEGVYHDIRGVYREVVPHQRLVFTWNLHDGKPEAESVVSVTLRPDGRGGTVLEFLQAPIFDPRSADGWRGVLERLGELVQRFD
jgi:uncharacterized protein YndB with AHSA1/START domain